MSQVRPDRKPSLVQFDIQAGQALCGRILATQARIERLVLHQTDERGSDSGYQWTQARQPDRPAGDDCRGLPRGSCQIGSLPADLDVASLRFGRRMWRDAKSASAIGKQDCPRRPAFPPVVPGAKARSPIVSVATRSPSLSPVVPDGRQGVRASRSPRPSYR